jgi:hypothetical protein
MNIILKSFDGPLHRATATSAFRGYAIDTCIYITNNNEDDPQINAKNMIWMPAALLREGHYPDVDWNTILPLDAELIENMRNCEMRFLYMVERYAKHCVLSYRDRKRQYLEHLRFWNHTLEQEHIDLCVMNHAPHQAYDLVLYELCKLKNIPVMHLERCYSVEGVLVSEDFEKSDENLLTTFTKLKAEYANPEKEVPLSPSYEKFFQGETNDEDNAPWFAISREKYMTQKSFLAKWGRKSLNLMQRKPWEFLSAALSPSTWSRKLAQHHTALLYDKLTSLPDLSAPYIYAPLQAQPEEGISPRAGAFENQELIIQMLAACAPDGVRIYVKEHPNQGEMYRNEAFYQTMADIPAVTLVPRTFDTFELIRNSKAVATATGTAGLQALFRGKPFLMFGHRWCQYAPGVYKIRTTKDCQDAMQDIFTRDIVPSLHDLRVFLKAVEECSVPFEGGPNIPGKSSPHDRAVGMGEMLHKKLEPLFT